MTLVIIILVFAWTALILRAAAVENWPTALKWTVLVVGALLIGAFLS